MATVPARLRPALPRQVRAWREAANLSYEDASQRLGVSARQYRRYENGECRIPFWLTRFLHQERSA